MSDSTMQISQIHPPRSRRLLKLILIAGAVVALVALGGWFNPAFLTPENGLAILRAAAMSGIVAMGATFITISGRFFSLALGQTAMFAGVFMAVLMAQGLPFGLAVAVMLLAVVAIGAVQGAIISMGANPIITTLGAGALLAGLAGLTTGGRNIAIESSVVEWIGNGRILGVPTQTWAFLVSVAVAWWVINKTRFGRETILIGANRATAGASGLSVSRITILVFIIASLAAAMMGVFEAAQFSKARVAGFGAVDFDVIAAVLIGGTAIQGGKGSPFRAALGAVFIATLQNYMLLLAWSSGVRTLITGAFIVLIVAGFHIAGRRKGA
ncbi:ABC transporter permease [Salipiger bermudensis]|uniref:ABC transporter permease n=1 Tax=Salipiger bermudensis TaxID=344736 RepID=UPI00300A92F5